MSPGICNLYLENEIKTKITVHKFFFSVRYLSIKQYRIAVHWVYIPLPSVLCLSGLIEPWSRNHFSTCIIQSLDRLEEKTLPSLVSVCKYHFVSFLYAMWCRDFPLSLRNFTFLEKNLTNVASQKRSVQVSYWIVNHPLELPLLVYAIFNNYSSSPNGL